MTRFLKSRGVRCDIGKDPELRPGDEQQPLGNDASTPQGCLHAWVLGQRARGPDPCAAQTGRQGSYSLGKVDGGSGVRPGQRTRVGLEDTGGDDHSEERQVGPAETKGSPSELHSDT